MRHGRRQYGLQRRRYRAGVRLHPGQRDRLRVVVSVPIVSGTAPACPAPLPGTRTFIRGYSTVSGTGDPTAVKQAIVSGGPVATILDVYANLLDYQSGVYTHGGAAVGNHGITLVGYSESGGYWIARNSWGTAWGMSGYFLIGYAENNVTLELEYSVLPGAIVE